MKENHFLKNGVNIPSHIGADPLDSEEEEDEDEDMSDFIVDDEVANEPFTHAQPDNDFVRDTHQAVHDYNRWEPKINRKK